MGEAKRRQSATQELIAKFPNCFFCGGRRLSATREHMPPTSLFDNSHRPSKLVMPACSKCNAETSTADLTAAIISRWDYFSSDQSNWDHRRLLERVRRQAPELMKEWSKLGDAPEIEKERARQHLRDYGVLVPRDAGVATIGPVTIAQLNLFSHKVVLALHFEHAQKPLPMSGRVSAYWRTKEDFASVGGVPPQLISIFRGYGTLVQGSWNESKTFEYRHDINHKDGIFGCAAKFRRGLFVLGFTLIDPSVMPTDDDGVWFEPADPMDLLADPRFQHKH